MATCNGEIEFEHAARDTKVLVRMNRGIERVGE